VAKKSRTPPPPRRVQAPKQRSSEPPAGRRRRLLLVGGVVTVAALVAAGAVLAYVFLGGEGSTDETLRAAGCTIVKKPALGRGHVNALAKGFEYNTFPGTTGPHFGATVPWDFYSEPIEEYRLVHNLEHGGLVVEYGKDVPEATVSRIRDWYLKDPNGVIVAPLPALNDKIAFLAWTSPDAPLGQTPGPGQGVVATCADFSEKAVDAFASTYSFRGPERYPRSALTPGV
jgi:hypothetical protein